MTVSQLQEESIVSTSGLLVHNIKRLMAVTGLKEAILAKKTSIPQPTLHKILSQKTADPRISTLKRICAFFNISLDALMYTPAHERLDLGAEGVKIQTQNIPVITWQQCVEAGSFLTLLTPENWNNWQIVNVKSNKVVALVSKINMEPRFPAETLLLVNLNAKPVDGDLVAVHYPNTDEATLRLLCLDGPVKRLKAIRNEQDYDVCDDTRIVGVVIQATWNFHKSCKF